MGLVAAREIREKQHSEASTVGEDVSSSYQVMATFVYAYYL